MKNQPLMLMVWWYYTTAIYLNSMVIVYNWHLFCWPRDSIHQSLLLVVWRYYTTATVFDGIEILYNCHLFCCHGDTIELPLILMEWWYLCWFGLGFGVYSCFNVFVLSLRNLILNLSPDFGIYILLILYEFTLCC